MGEGVRLKNENLFQVPTNEPALQSQHPQQNTVPGNTLKETQTNNDIDFSIMDTKQKTVLDYLLSSEQGEISSKKLKIGEKTYNFDRNKPLSKRLIAKLNKIKQTLDYKKYELKEQRNIKWVNLGKNTALIGIQKRYKATITHEQLAFKNYTNSYSISNIRVKGIKALQDLKHQDYNLKQYLQKHKGMKVILETINTFKSKKTNEEVRHAIRSRRYEITNEEEIPNVLSQTYNFKWTR